MKMIGKLSCCGVSVALLMCLALPVQAAITGQYPLDNNALDSSGNNRNGNVVGGSFTTGLYQGSTGALLQTATGQSVELPPNSDFIRNAPGATLAAWVRPDSLSGTHTILVVNNGNTGSATGIGDARAVIQVLGGNTFRALGRFGDADGSVNITGGTPVLGETYFVAGVFDYANSGLRLYVNGQQVASSTISGWTSNSADTANLAARIGSHANGTQETWIGAIDGARIFNTALSATEILDIYTAEAFPGPLPGDTDNNGIVDGADLTPIRTNWRQTGKTRPEGNLSGDSGGLVDFADFRQWKTAFLGGGGSLDGLDLSFAVVPEPTSALLLFVGASGCCFRRRR